MITKIWDKDGMRYAVGELGVKEISDFTAAFHYPTFEIEYGDGTRKSVYNPEMTVEYTKDKE